MDDGEELRAQIGHLALRFIAAVVLHHQAVSVRVGLGAGDAQFLNLLNLNGPMTPGQFATVTGLTTGSVTGVLDRLERAGYTRRERDPNDRRRILVTPVPEGMARLAERYSEHMAAVLAAQGLEQLHTIAEFLQALIGDAGYVTPARTPQRAPGGPGSRRAS